MASEVVVLSRDQEGTAFIRNALKGQGCEVRSGAGLSSALRMLNGSELIVLSLDGKNAETLREIRSYYPESVVLVADSPEAAGRAFKEGAYDFIEKPLSQVRLSAAVRNALGFIAYRDELRRLKTTEAPHLVPSKNRKMLKALHQAGRAAARNAPLLILGEKGTGKEVIARAIHYGGARAAGPFVKVEHPATAGEAGLFGKAPARASLPGAVVSATGGTIYIENVEAIDAGLAKKLASFIRDGKFVPEGGAEALRADARVICSARSLDTEGPLFKSFRSKIHIPPLRERPEDIIALAEHFLKADCEALETGQKKFSKDARDYIAGHSWPGNAGELKNAVKKACLLARDEVVERRHLASGEGSAYCSVSEFLDDKIKAHLKGLAKIGGSGLYEAVTSEVEKALIELALKETGGNQIKASSVLGLNRNTLRAKIKLYRIKNGRGAKG